ncbi:hypothetical protein ACH34W_48375 [Actinomadura sp. 6N118]
MFFDEFAGPGITVADHVDGSHAEAFVLGVSFVLPRVHGGGRT